MTTVAVGSPFTQLACHLLAHLRSPGPECLYDPRYLAWCSAHGSAVSAPSGATKGADWTMEGRPCFYCTAQISTAPVAPMCGDPLTMAWASSASRAWIIMYPNSSKTPPMLKGSGTGPIQAPSAAWT